ncbi:purine-cytosine permease family protein [Sciscionella sediminilitoris]|uniref:purine-cytosine permease family protein n=1 Tax=Sciscionella sediminilitoris TaxID=1445613 RepID=UPI000ADCBDB0|nr:cytosine permease [Sciscionella sp. SE31]
MSGHDRFGKVEQAGIEYLSEHERTSRPANLFTVFFSGNLSFGVIVFGWLPVTYGLDFFDAVTSSLAGIALGTLLVAPLGLLGPRTGTSTPVSSGAHFGVTGRLVGSGITLLFALAYAAIAVWTSGDALIAVAHRVFGLSASDGTRAIGYGLIAIEVVVVALFGHGTVVAMQRFVLPVVAALLLLGLPAFAFGFRAAPAGTGHYLLGGHWQTWVFAVVIAIGGPLSYATGMGDYTRRVARRHGDRRVLLACGGGLFLGLGITSVFGSFTATAFGGLTGSYVQNLVAIAPAWYVLPVLLIALVGGLGQGVMTVYSSGLDLVALLPRLRRVHTTLITSIASVALVYLGAVATDAVDSITAMTVVLNGFAGPWVIITLIGFLRTRGRGYDPADLQVFNERRRGGRYWFTGGWNLRAVIPFALGSVFGLLAVDTELYHGPLAALAGGIDLSVLGSMAITGIGYLIALRCWPEPADPIAAAAPATRARITSQGEG